MADDLSLNIDPVFEAYGAVAERLELARALPRAAFADPRVFDAEVKLAMKGEWMPVARSSDVAKPGDFRAVDLLDEPLVVTRDPAGTLHVLSNLCRHRGFPVAEGAGNAKALTCPYHLWRYGLDGRLAAAPGMERSEIFERNSCALAEVRFCEWQGWVFVNLDGRAEPLAPRLAELSARLEPYGVASMVTAETLVFESPWNWKLMVENFMESYHHIGFHSETLQKSNPGLTTWVRETDDLFSILENPPVDETHPAFLVAVIFPLALISVIEGPTPGGIWYEMDQIEHNRFRLKIHILSTPEQAADPEFRARNRALSEVIHGEDIPACEGAQRGVTSPAYEPGPLSHLEGSLWRLHRFLQKKLLQPAA